MKNTAFLLSFLLIFSSCASRKPISNQVGGQNQRNSRSSQAMAEKPERVLRAARAVLEGLVRKSNPPATDSVKGDENVVYTGWVYGVAKNEKKGTEEANISTRSKEPWLRRIYGFTVTPFESGSRVELTVEEEIQLFDSQNKKPQGWKRVEPKPAVYEILLSELREKVRFN